MTQTDICIGSHTLAMITSVMNAGSTHMRNVHMVQFEQTHPADTLMEISPENTLRDFAKFLTEIRPRYEEAARLQEQYEMEETDINHYIELHPNLSAPNGNKIYRKLAEVLRKRRACKLEVELLEPMYQFVLKYGNLHDSLSAIQGKTKAVREKLEARTYTCRTNILEDMPE